MYVHLLVYGDNGHFLSGRPEVDTSNRDVLKWGHLRFKRTPFAVHYLHIWTTASPKWSQFVLSNCLTRSQVTGWCPASRLSPYQTLATVLRPPSMGTYSDIPFRHVEWNGGIPFSREYWKNNACGFVATAIIRYWRRTSL